MYIAWMSQVNHWGLPLNPQWEKENYQRFIQDETAPDTIDTYLNSIRETDDNVKAIITGFRKRGLEDETLFIMYFLFNIFLIKSRGSWIPPYRQNANPR